MAQVSIAVGTNYLRALHAVSGIRMLLNAAATQWPIKAWPAAASIKLVLVLKQWRVAAYAVVNALGVANLIITGERALGAFLTRYAVLLGG
ncbi:hypothetical protein HORIV_20080 [Vreelandella olivaria]|uniref:Uncharacterized protein n=1 Tax=Vreelandella olivaria TaxID=390919 RepID=A0ABM7GGF4_9GAMM|nr:hypothetical protein HORIV_20080 [Halomonas olivaria]